MSVILLNIYLFSLIVLCLFGYLIAAFYKKKFQKDVFRFGFVGAMICFMLGAVLLPIGRPVQQYAAIFVSAGSMFAGYNAIRLYFTMRRPGK